MILRTVNTLFTTRRLLARRFPRSTDSRTASAPNRACSVDARGLEDSTASERSQNPSQDPWLRAEDASSNPGIVCGTDFSIHAREAADVAATLALKWGGSMTLAHIVEPARGDATSSTLNAMLRYKKRNRLKNETELLRARGVIVNEAFLSGSPAAELVKCAIKQRARLIVVSSVGSLLPTRLLLGSVAEQTAYLSPVPVLVVRDPKPFKAWASGKRSLNIIVGHDFSASADAALDWVAALRKIGHCRITVAHLATTQVATGWLEVDGKSTPKSSLVKVRQLLKGDLVQRCREALGKTKFQVEIIPVRDSVASRLVSLAHAHRADLIVVGTNQKGMLRRLCLGSVSRGVLREALVSVGCVPVMSNPIAGCSPH